jgi:hypothetical protein
MSDTFLKVVSVILFSVLAEGCNLTRFLLYQLPLDL